MLLYVDWQKRPDTHDRHRLLLGYGMDQHKLKLRMASLDDVPCFAGASLGTLHADVSSCSDNESAFDVAPTLQMAQPMDDLPFRFLSLPLELREIIYGMLCYDEPPRLAPGQKALGHPSGILRVNRQAHDEFLGYLTVMAPLTVLEVQDFDFQHVTGFLDRLPDYQLSRLPRRPPPRRDSFTGAVMFDTSAELCGSEYSFMGGTRMFALELERQLDWSAIIYGDPFFNLKQKQWTLQHGHPSNRLRRMQIHMRFSNPSLADLDPIKSWLDRALVQQSKGLQIDFEYCFPQMERSCFSLLFDEFLTWVRSEGRGAEMEVRKIVSAPRFLGPSALAELRAIWLGFQSPTVGACVTAARV
ncbi:hypothetical protein K431DRAFT_149988 [Polychaeton citri CBS 116435]|uniref:F-box domain-containing protein n=1 Tax=Polychaeton citri CBS 116435 TaxID=1314669 RepID=A0A9P4Q1D1_9PEZI|nr:hypothetical protein K431DRAFT_149988 [Polychaeton citri CBS 116435]